MSNNTTFDGAHAALAALAVVLLAVAAFGAVATPAAADAGVVAQTDGNETVNETAAETEPESDDELTLAELREPGATVENAPPSVRRIGSEGAVAIKHSPIDPLSPAEAFLEPGTEINSNAIEIQSTRFGAGIQPIDVTVHTAFYKTTTRDVVDAEGDKITEETVATDVHRGEADAELGTGYDATEVSLTPHFDETYNMVIWITDSNGDQLGDARWSDGLTHRSSDAAAPVDIDNQSDLFGFIGVNILLIGVVGLLTGFGAGRHVLDKIGRGTGLGLGAYGVMFAVIAFVLAAFAYIETTAVIANIPAVWGVVIALVGFIGYVETAGPNDRRVLFEKDVLTEARSASGEEVVDAVYEDVAEKLAIYREDGSIGLPKDGIRPAFARYFANAATLDSIDLATSVEVRGDFDEKYIADPDSEFVLAHTPAHLEWDPQIVAEPDDEDDPAGVLERLNWSFLAASAVLIGGGWYAADAVVGFGSVGVLGGLLGVAVLGHKAVDGHADFEPAPIHMRPAKATVKNTSIEYDDAKTIEETDRQLYKATATSAAEIRRRAAEQSRVTSRKLMEESTGVNFDPDEEASGSTPAERPEGRRERRTNGEGNTEPDTGPDEDTDGEWRDA